MLTGVVFYWISSQEIQMQKGFSADQWTAWLVEFERSGLSVSEFCNRINVNQKSFYRWRKKLQDSTADSQPQFVNVVLPTTRQVSIELPCGAIMRVDNQCDALEPVLQTLLQLGASQQ